MIYVFGNSHSHFFTGEEPGKSGFGNSRNEHFTSYSLGPVIAYNFMQNHYPTMKNVLSNINFEKSKDYVLLAVGEVDCRWHLPYQSTQQKRDYTEVVEECINRLFEVYVDLVSNGYNVIGWGGHPSTTQGHDDNPDCPVFGDCHFRNSISRLWNKLLTEKCLSEGIPVVSIIEDLISEDGLTKMEYFRDYCHLDYDKTIELAFEKFNKLRLLD